MNPDTLLKICAYCALISVLSVVVAVMGLVLS